MFRYQPTQLLPGLLLFLVASAGGGAISDPGLKRSATKLESAKNNSGAVVIVMVMAMVLIMISLLS